MTEPVKDEKALLEEYNKELKDRIIIMESRLYAMRHALRTYSFDIQYMTGYTICHVCGGLWQTDSGVELHRGKCMADKEYNDFGN